MKIAIPNFRGVDTFVDNVAHTLEAMGHDVITMGTPPGLRFLLRARALTMELGERMGVDVPSPQESWLRRVARDTRLNMVLALTQGLVPDTLALLKRRGVGRVVAWWGDSPANMTRWGVLDSHWDAIFLKDANAVRKLRLLKLNAHHLHEAMNPAWHRPMAVRGNDTVAIAGSWYAFRQLLAAQLTSAGIDVAMYGPALPRWGLPELKARHSGRYLVREEKSRVFGEALACLNSAALSEGDAVTCRTFEIAGAAGLQIMEYRPAIEECFEPGAEVLTFTSSDELMEHISRAKLHPREADAIRQAGARRALHEHTYRHRLLTIFKSIGIDG